ncbi:transporter substrate-binding domain-containing protein [Desulfobacterales bacterium HSG17]|nr:transporter substrate-binding domain-containing protein [Desulfobacterales bacterium HSG17]
MLSRKHLIKCLLIPVVIALVLLGSKVIAANSPVRSPHSLISASEIGYPPFALTRIDGTADGFSVDMLKAVARAVNLKVNFKVAPWYQIKQELVDGQLDVLPLVSFSEERDEVYDFTASYLRMHGTAFVRRGEKEIYSEADLRDKEVIVMRGDTAHEYAIKKNLSDRLILVDNYEDAMQLLSKGRHDAILVQHLVGLQLINKLNISNIVSINSFHETNLKPESAPLGGFEQKFCFAVQEGDKELLAILNEGLSIVISDGTYDKLYHKWFGPILPQPQVPLMVIVRSLIVFTIPVLFLLAAAGLWYLRSEVTRNTQNLTLEIFERQRVERALREKEVFLNSLLNEIPIPVFYKNRQGKYLGFNRSFEIFFGQTKDQLIGKTMFDIFPPALADILHTKDAELLEKKEDVQFESQIETAQGSVCDTIISKALFHDSQGNVGGMIGTILDTTERKQMEKTLRLIAETGNISDQEFFKFMVRHLAISQDVRYALIAQINSDDSSVAQTIAVWGNGEFIENFQYKLEGTPCSNVHMKGPCYYSNNIQNLFPEDHLLVEMEAESYWGIPLTNNKNKVLGVLAILDDKPMDSSPQSQSILSSFSMRIASEIERKQSEDALWESKDRFQKVFNSHLDAIFVLNMEYPSRIVECNNAARAIFGYENFEIIGESIDKLHIDEVYFKEFQGQLNTNIDMDGCLETFEFSMKRKDGTIFSSEHTELELNDDKGNRLGWVSIIRDLTERKQTEERLRQAQKMQSIGNLAGGIAHDFNNILFPIVGMSEMLMEDFPIDSMEYENSQEIFNAATRGSELVKQILAFSRQSGLKKIPIRVQTVLKEVLKLSRSTIPTNIQILKNIKNDCGLVLADPTQLHQIIINLITNASHAVEGTNGKITVNLDEIEVNHNDSDGNSFDQGQYVLLSVADTGCGIDEAIMNRIFEPYFTTKKQGKGTGLGLAVVYGIVNEHAGQIKVQSELDKGTTFNVYLPLMSKIPEMISTQKIKALQGGTERILLVDDEEPIARLGKRVLERLGYKVTDRTSSIDALAAFKAHSGEFDLVISDMAMPNMTGDQLAAKLISIKPDIPVIICTGFSNTINSKRAMEIGIKGFLMKPMVKSEMVQMVREVLDEAKRVS